jgi:head-tail adaptor
MTIAIGELRDRVAIQQATRTPDGEGGYDVSWPGTVIAIVWAKVTPASAGDEALRSDAVTAVHRYEVTIRYRADVAPKMRLSWTPYQGAAKVLEIQSVQLLDRAHVRLDCVEAS